MKGGKLMPGKTRKASGDISSNHTIHHTSSVDIKLLNELLQLLRKQALSSGSSGVQLKKQQRKRRKREPGIGFNLLIFHRLYVQLKNYVKLYAGRGESMTEIILTGLEKELKERYAKKVLPERAQSDVRGETN